MEYKGKLYGKVGNSLIPLEATTEDFERYKALYLEGRELLEGSLSLLKQTEAHRKATGLTLGNIFLESQIEQTETFLTKTNTPNRDGE